MPLLIWMEGEHEKFHWFPQEPEHWTLSSKQLICGTSEWVWVYVPKLLVICAQLRPLPSALAKPNWAGKGKAGAALLSSRARAASLLDGGWLGGTATKIWGPSGSSIKGGSLIQTSSQYSSDIFFTNTFNMCNRQVNTIPPRETDPTDPTGVYRVQSSNVSS